jgi:hypothetical protein
MTNKSILKIVAVISIALGLCYMVYQFITIEDTPNADRSYLFFGLVVVSLASLLYNYAKKQEG